MRKFLMFIWLLMGMFIMSGCGVAGGTRVMPVIIDTHSLAPVANIKLTKVALEDDAAILANNHCYAWGKFSESDLANFKKSLEESFRLWPNDSKLAQVRSIYVVIRKYYVTTGNSSGAVLACIAWCVADENNNIVFEEQFYAGINTGGTTIGYIKDMVNKSIIQRIVDVSVFLSSPKMQAESLPDMPRLVFKDFETAKTMLPGRLTSIFSDRRSTTYIYEGTRFDRARPDGAINWDEYIKPDVDETAIEHKQENVDTL